MGATRWWSAPATPEIDRGLRVFRPVPLPAEIPGRLYLHGMPGTSEPWPKFIAEARRLRLDAVACLVPDGEIAEKSPAYAAALSGGELFWQHRPFPIPDFGTPPALKTAAFHVFIAGLARRLREGGSLLVHCGAGIGRTGTTAICLLIELGMPLGKAIDAVERAGSHPETGAQREFVGRFAGGVGPGEHKPHP